MFRDGEWQLCETQRMARQLQLPEPCDVVLEERVDRYLIAVNLGDSAVQARIPIPWGEIAGATWRLTDQMSGVIYDRDGTEMVSPGLFVEVEPWGYNFFQCHRAV